MATIEDKQAEVDRNYECFVKKLGSIQKEHQGQYALMHNGKIRSYHDSFIKAREQGIEKYSDGIFSIQKVDGDPVDLGYYSHA